MYILKLVASLPPCALLRATLPAEPLLDGLPPLQTHAHIHPRSHKRTHGLSDDGAKHSNSVPRERRHTPSALSADPVSRHTPARRRTRRAGECTL